MSSKNNSIYITSYERRNINNNEQNTYYSDPTVISAIEQAGMSTQLQDSHSRRHYYNHAISLASENTLNEHATNLYYFAQHEDANKIESLFKLERSSSSGFLVPGLISYSNNVLIFELPPTHKMVSHVPVNKDNINEDVLAAYKVDSYIPIPWQVYIAIFNNDKRLIDTYMYYSRNSIIASGIEEPLYSPTLPNFYSNGMLCRPFYSSMEDVEKYSQDLSGIFAAAYDSVWNSGWNADLIDTIMDLTPHTCYPVNQRRSESFKHAKEYFESQGKLNVFENHYNRINIISGNSRNKSFSLYINSILNFSLNDIVNSIFPVPSANQLWENDYETIKENLAEEFFEDNDPDCYNEDDLSQFIDDGVSLLRFKLKSFKDIVSNVLHVSSRHNLYQLTAGSYKSNSQHLSENILHY